MSRNSSHLQSHSARGYTLSVLAAAILSTTAIFIRYLYQSYHIPPLVLALWRDIFVVVTLLPVLGLFYPQLVRVHRSLLYYLVTYGFVLALFNAMWTLSVALNGAAAATVLVYSSVAFTALLGRWYLKEYLGEVKILAIIFCLSGCLFVCEAWKAHSWHTNITGIVTGILSGLCYSLFSLMGRSASQRGATTSGRCSCSGSRFS